VAGAAFETEPEGFPRDERTRSQGQGRSFPP
jgi:hypothetical protein